MAAQPVLPGAIAPVSARCLHTGGAPAVDSAAGNNSTPVVTEIYLAEVFVPVRTRVTGIAVFNGSDATDSVKCGLYNSNGVLLAATADTQVTGVDTYQRHAFTVNGANAAFTELELAPGSYYIACIYDGIVSRFNTHAVGSFGAGKLTGHVYATAFNTTALTVTVPTTFTTALGPLASLY